MALARDWALTLGLLTACTGGEASATRDALTAMASSPVPFDPSSSVAASFSGVIVTTRSRHITAEVAGIVDEITADVGETVALGEVVVRLRAQPFEDALAIADAVVVGQEAQLASAQGDAAIADAELAEARRLADAGHLPAADLRRAMATHDRAVSAARIARASLQAARSERLQARHALEAASVRAGGSGTVAARFVDPGQGVAAGAVLLRTADPTAIAVRFGVPERLRAALDEGHALEITNAEGTTRWAAVVTHLAPEVDVSTELVAVEATLSLPPATPPPSIGAAVSVRPR